MNKEKIIEVLKTVIDPEILVDIYTLGLIYNIEEDNGSINIRMTLTSPMCPFGPELINDVKLKLGVIEGIKEVKVDLVFEPVWQPSDELKLMLGVK